MDQKFTVPLEIDTHYQLYGKHMWEVNYLKNVLDAINELTNLAIAHVLVLQIIKPPHILNQFDRNFC